MPLPQGDHGRLLQHTVQKRFGRKFVWLVGTIQPCPPYPANNIFIHHWEFCVINTIAQASAFILLLIGSFTFGMLSKPTEMGLCILAAAIALAFSNIEKIKRFKGAGFEAEMLEKQVEAMIAKEAEPEVKEEQSIRSVKAYSLDESTRSVVIALGNSKYTWRTISGIIQESGQSSALVRRAINWLMTNDLVVQAGMAKSPNWGLSEEGRKLYNSIKASEGAV